MSVPLEALRRPGTADVCCFCGQVVRHSGADRLSLSVRWKNDATERTQSWGAHRTCLTERMHDTVKGTGPFFAD
jgi:hypothetical protein